MKNALSKGFAYFASASFISIFVQLIKGKITAVILGASGVGVYGQLTNLFSFFFTVSGLGFQNGIVKGVSQSISNDDLVGISRQLSTTFLFLSAFSLLSVVVGVIFSGDISNFLFSDKGEKRILVILTILCVPFSVIAQVYRAILSGYSAVKNIVVAQIVSDVLSLIPFVILVLNYNLIGAVTSFSIYQAIKLFFNAYYFNKLVGIKKIFPRISHYDYATVISNIRFGGSGLLLVSLNLVVMMLVSKLIISSFGESSNGIFFVAMRVATIYLGVIYANASSFYFPMLVKSKNNEELAEVVNTTCSFYMYIMPPIVITLMSLGDVLITILFNNEFVFAAALLLLILPGDIFRVLSETMTLPFLAKENFMIYNGAYIFWVICYLSLAMLLLDKFGLVGVAIAYLCSYSLGFVLSMFLLKTWLKIKLNKQFIFSFVLAFTFIGISALLNFMLEDFILKLLINIYIVIIWFCFSMLQRDFKELFITYTNKLRGVLNV